MGIDKVYRNEDVIYGDSDLEFLYSFDSFPTYMGVTSSPREEDTFFDMSWHISKKSGIIQLNPLLPLDVLYSMGHGSGTTGKSWQYHHNSFAEFVCDNCLSQVLEIGGLHGALAAACKKENSNLKWTIIEPNPKVPEDLDVDIITGFFDKDFVFDKPYDTIVHSHVFEHIYNPDEFMNDIFSNMNDGDRLVFSIPHMEEMLKRKYTNCINFEHTLYLIEPYVEHYLDKYNIKVIDKKYYKDDHSIFYACEKHSDHERSLELNQSLYENNKKLFLSYIEHHKSDVEKINKLINNTDSKVFLFGAHVFSQYLFAFGLEEGKIECILDNDENKANKRLYGTGLLSFSPKILKDENNPTVILRAGVYNCEIKEDILNNINPGTKFV